MHINERKAELNYMEVSQYAVCSLAIGVVCLCTRVFVVQSADSVFWYMSSCVRPIPSVGVSTLAAMEACIAIHC